MEEEFREERVSEGEGGYVEEACGVELQEKMKGKKGRFESEELRMGHRGTNVVSSCSRELVVGSQNEEFHGEDGRSGGKGEERSKKVVVGPEVIPLIVDAELDTARENARKGRGRVQFEAKRRSNEHGSPQGKSASQGQTHITRSSSPGMCSRKQFEK